MTSNTPKNDDDDIIIIIIGKAKKAMDEHPVAVGAALAFIVGCVVVWLL